MYLLDTNIVSELRRPRPHGGVVAWLNAIPESSVYLSAITIGEIQRGVERLRARDAAKAAEIEDWLERLINTFNILAMDANVFRCWGRIMLGASDTLTLDGMIAATAMVHNCTLATRNTRDMQQFPVRIRNPFEPL